MSLSIANLQRPTAPRNRKRPLCMTTTSNPVERPLTCTPAGGVLGTAQRRTQEFIQRTCCSRGGPGISQKGAESGGGSGRRKSPRLGSGAKARWGGGLGCGDDIAEKLKQNVKLVNNFNVQIKSNLFVSTSTETMHNAKPIITQT